MDGIRTSEAITYGLKHMVYLSFVYLLGFAAMGLGILFVVDNSVGMGVLFILAGITIILGGLHGAIYKMAGDATARVMNRSEIPQAAASSSDSSDEENDEESASSHPDPAISGE